MFEVSELCSGPGRMGHLADHDVVDLAVSEVHVFVHWIVIVIICLVAVDIFVVVLVSLKCLFCPRSTIEVVH